MWRQIFEYHPIIGYRFIPGLRARIRRADGAYLIRVNDVGFRCDHDFVNEKKPGTRRVLLFGDSYTAGDGVSNGNRFGDLLEDEIPNLEVYNFGLPGTGTDQQYLAYREYADGIEHDLLIIAIFIENIRRVAAHYRYYFNENGEQVCYEKPYYELINSRMVLRNVPPSRHPILESDLSKEERNAIDRGAPVARMANWLNGRGMKDLSVTLGKQINKKGLKDLVQRWIRYQPLPEYGSPNSQAWQIMRAILEEWIGNHSRKVLLVLIPCHQYVEEIADPSHYQARYRNLAFSLEDCALHDPMPDLLKYSFEDRRRFRLQEGHLTPKGHAVLTRSLVPVLEDLLDKSAAEGLP